MRISFFAIAIGLSTLIACERNNHAGQGIISNSTTDNEFISLDSGNKMVTSYINSINYATNDTDLRSLIIDAGQLRKYLDSETNSPNITQVKISFAHTLAYINSGHGNQYAGYKSGALTVILSGVDDSGNYVFFPDNLIIDRSSNCPTNCPSGTAGNNLFTSTTVRR